jgi:5-methylthioribose kinase
MRNYSEHFLMNVEDVKKYVVDVVKYFDSVEGLISKELSDGNINYVYKVEDPKTGRSLVIKQADKFLRSSGRPLDLHRNKIEAEILRIENELTPGFVPKIYHYDKAMAAISMEDISDFKNMRLELNKGILFPDFAEQISSFMVNTLLPTTDLVITKKEKKERVQLFTNIELCDISEDLVFTEPYYDYKGRNIITEGNEKFVEENLYNNEELKAEVGKLRNGFMNNAQALIHGDLHSGSIFINQDGIKVIDPEFAFYGPMGYDIGNVIGNLYFSLVNKLYTDSNNLEFIKWIKEEIVLVYDLTFEKLSNKFDEIVKFPLYNEAFKIDYLSKVSADTLGCAGTEIIRRTVGDSKVLEVNEVIDLSVKIPMERTLINFGIELIKKREEFYKGEQLIGLFDSIKK